jgi:alpha-glucosidase
MTAPEGWVCWAFSNHDVPRHVSRWVRLGRRLSMRCRQVLDHRFLACLRGSICIYQGEELGLTEADLAYRGFAGSIRHPLLAGLQGSRWLPHADGLGRRGSQWRLLHRERHGFRCRAEHVARAVDVQDKTAGSVLNHYRAMLKMRRESPALMRGTIRLVDGHDKDVLAFEREAEGERLLCAFNFGTETVRLAGPEGTELPPLGWQVKPS